MITEALHILAGSIFIQSQIYFFKIQLVQHLDITKTDFKRERERERERETNINIIKLQSHFCMKLYFEEKR